MAAEKGSLDATKAILKQMGVMHRDDPTDVSAAAACVRTYRLAPKGVCTHHYLLGHPGPARALSMRVHSCYDAWLGRAQQIKMHMHGPYLTAAAPARCCGACGACARDVQKEKRSAFHVAAIAGHVAVMEELLKNQGHYHRIEPDDIDGVRA